MSLAARRQWNPPAQLSVLYNQSGQAVASVALGSAGPVASTLEVTVGGEVVFSHALVPTTATQSVVLPRTLPLQASRVLLVSGGHTRRAVDG